MRADPPGMVWLARLIAGPTLWAVAFSAVYGLHGLGCALGWTGQGWTGQGWLDLHRLAMLAAWALALAAHVPLLIRFPQGPGLRFVLPRLGLWIGLASTFFTLLPVLVTSSC